jgi:hypothetical protein
VIAPPPDGGFLVLNAVEIGNLDLLCAIKRAFPKTRIFAQHAMSKEAAQVLRMGNTSPRPPGIAGYYMRREARPQEALQNAMAKLEAQS